MSNYQEIDSLEDKLTEMIRGRATYGDRRTAQREFEQRIAFSLPEWPTF